MLVAEQISAAFAEAKGRYRELDRKWIALSNRFGSRLQPSLLAWSIRREGSVDLILRAMEDERRRQTASPFSSHYARLLSEYWVSGLYESFRLLLDRELLTPSEQEPFKAIFADLDPIRMTIDKHEIAKDRKFSAPIELVRTPSKGTEDVLEYDPKDKRGKSHIAPVALFPNGSLGWHVIEAASRSERWVDRQSLSDRVLKLIGDNPPSE